MKYKELFSLKGKNAVVTGGAGFLGRRFCAGLAAFGANVAVVDVNAKEAQAVADDLRAQYPVRVLGIGCDVSNPSSVKKMTDKAAKALGGIHVLHNNAAYGAKGRPKFFDPFEKYSTGEWRRAMSVNIDGMFLVAQAVGNVMLKQRTGGSIIQTASIYGIMAPDQRIYEGLSKNKRINAPAVYSASKGGVVALTKYLAAYWADKGIRVNTLTPGGVQNGQKKNFQKKYSARVPMGRMAEADEMVGALIYLASDASAYVTGHNLAVDGGLSAW